MDRDRIIATLRQHSGELRSSGVAHLRPFGCAARGEENASSDIDLLVEFDEPKQLTLVRVASLEHRLQTMLDGRVELSGTEWISEAARGRIYEEAILAF